MASRAHLGLNISSKFSARGIGDLAAHPVKTATAPANKAAPIAFANTMISLLHIGTAGFEKQHPSDSKIILVVNHDKNKKKVVQICTNACFLLFLSHCGQCSGCSNLCSAFLQNFKRRQCFAFQHFQKCAPAGGDITHLLFNSVFGDGRQCVATARNTESL